MQFPTLHVVRYASFTPTPWKNGGGITHEAIRVPAVGEPFHWRVSVAHIAASGPFSEFAEYTRKMVLLRGAGLVLRFAGGGEKRLLQAGDLAEFDGAIATECELLGGPCVDLNLMVCKSNKVSARVQAVRASLSLKASPKGSTVVFCIGDPVLLETDGGESVTLETWDLAVLSQCGGRIRNCKSAGGSPVISTVFVASL